MKRFLSISSAVLAMSFVLVLLLKPQESGVETIPDVTEAGTEPGTTAATPPPKIKVADVDLPNRKNHDEALPDNIVDQSITSVVEHIAKAGFTRETFDRATFTNTNPRVRVDDRARIQLYLRVAQTDQATLDDLRDHGVEIELTSDELAVVQGWAYFDDIGAISSLPGVKRIGPPSYPHVNRGSVQTEGDTIHFAHLLRGQGLNGEGMKIGVISDGANDMADAVALGDLPNGVQSYGTCSKRSGDRTECLTSWNCNEGTAIMEIIHDMAPEASLAIGAVGTSLEFIQRVDDLTNDFGADVIIDDLGFYLQPYFEDGDIAQAVAAVTDDVIFVSSAGNSRDNHYERDYLSTDFSTLGGTYNLHDFAAGNEDGSFDITMWNGGYVVAILQWNDAHGSSSNDYDLLLTNEAETSILAQSNEVQSGSGDPAEAFCYHNGTGSAQTAKLMVNKISGDNKRIEMFVFGAQISNQYNDRDGSIFGHAAVPGIISVAAADVGLTSLTADYSSMGPSRVDFPERQDRQKPDLVGIAGVSVTGTGGFPSTFFGTSAAAPHVAAIAALLKQMSPESSPAVIKAAMMLSADEMHSTGWDTFSGAGRADAFDARMYLLNNADDDSDLDGVRDLEDAFPEDNTETLDTDGDNVGNVADTDDDGDGVEDSIDEDPLDASLTGIVSSGGSGVEEPSEGGAAGEYSARAYLMTTSTSNNVSELHIINTSSGDLTFSGTLYNGDGDQQGSASIELNSTATTSKGRLILGADDLETLFAVSPWSGPAMLDVTADGSFEVMIKLTSPSGLVSNTNCVKDGSVSNIEGFDSSGLSYVRFINTSGATLSSITGTLYTSDGEIIGNSGVELVSSLAANEAVWLNRNQLSDLVADTWNGDAMLDVVDLDGLKLLNLNFINSETFFNFSCYDSVAEDNIKTTCSDPRPDACTQDIDYVCAQRDNGEGGSEWATYSNACSACSDGLVVSHYPGQCEVRLNGQ